MQPPEELCDGNDLACADLGPAYLPDAAACTKNCDATAKLCTACGNTTDLNDKSPWPTFGGCSTHPGRSGVVGPQLAPSVLWEAPLKGAVPLGQPAILPSGRAVLTVRDGSEFSLRIVGPNFEKALPLGLSASPSATLGRDGIFVCGDGTLWQFDPEGAIIGSTPIPGSCTTTPLLDGGRVYVGTQSGHVLAYALPKLTPVFDQDLGGRIRSGFVPRVGPGGGVVVATHGALQGALYWLNAGGDVEHTLPYTYDGDPFQETGPVPVSTADGEIRFLRPGHMNTLPAVLRLSQDSSLIAAQPWGTAKPAWHSVAILPDGTSAVASQDALHLIKPDGTVKLTSAAPSEFRTSPVVDSQGTIFIQGFEHLRAISASGLVLWTKGFEYMVSTTAPALGRDVAGKGLVYAAIKESSTTKLKVFR